MRKPDESVLQELQQAIEANLPERVRALIEAGVSVDQKVGDSPKKTPLEKAVESNSLNVVKYLIVAGANLDKGVYKPLVHAALFNRTEIAGMLLEAGANPDVTVSTPEEHLRDETALMHAVDRPEKVRIVELLLKHQANPNLTNNRGLSALDYAVDAENIVAVRLLLEAGCLPAGPILHGPVFNGTKVGLELVKILIAAGADLNATGNREAHLDGRTPLEGARQQLKDRAYMIGLLERREREDWEEETLERWKSEASIFEEMIQLLNKAS